MGNTAVLKFGIAVAAVLVIVGIVYGTIQAEEEFNNDDAQIILATSTPVVVATAEPMTPEEAARLTAPLPAYLEPAPPREYVLSGSDILVQVRGGDDPCRFLYTGNHVGTLAGTEIGLWFVAGVWEADLEEYDEMDLYGPNGPHLFYFKDRHGQAFAMTEVGRGETVYVPVTFPEPGWYYLFDRRAAELGIVGEYYARPEGTPGSMGATDWCPS